jgi:hypothetical protein
VGWVGGSEGNGLGGKAPRDGAAPLSSRGAVTSPAAHFLERGGLVLGEGGEMVGRGGLRVAYGGTRPTGLK